MPFKVVQVVVCIIRMSFFAPELYSILWMYHSWYPFSYWRTFGLFLVFSNYDYSWCKHSCRVFCIDISFHFSRVAVNRLCPNFPVACFCMALWAKNAFYICKGLFKKREREYATETICGPQSLEYVMADYSRKKFANPCFRVNTQEWVS